MMTLRPRYRLRLCANRSHIDFAHHETGRLISLSGADKSHAKAGRGRWVRAVYCQRTSGAGVFGKIGLWRGAARGSWGDASGRRYERLLMPDEARFIFMDWPQSPLPDAASSYAQQAHLGTKTDSFVCISAYLRSLGLTAPRLFAADLAQGFLVLEDFLGVCP